MRAPIRGRPAPACLAGRHGDAAHHRRSPQDRIASALFVRRHRVRRTAQLPIALAGGGRLMKFIPYPVIAGLTTGTGLLLILSQIKPLLGISYGGL